MTVAEIIVVLNNHGFEDTDDVEKMEAMNDAYYDVCSRERWPFLESEADVAVSAGSVNVTEPTDMSKVVNIRVESLARKLEPERLENIYAADPALVETGPPIFYYFVGDQLRIWPKPDAAYTLKVTYERWPTELTTGSGEAAILLPVRHHRVLVTGTLFKLYLMEDDSELSEQFERHFETRIERMRADLHARQIDRTEYIVDLNPEDYENFPWRY